MRHRCASSAVCCPSLPPNIDSIGHDEAGAPGQHICRPPAACALRWSVPSADPPLPPLSRRLGIHRHHRGVLPCGRAALREAAAPQGDIEGGKSAREMPCDAVRIWAIPSAVQLLAPSLSPAGRVRDVCACRAVMSRRSAGKEVGPFPARRHDAWQDTRSGGAGRYRAGDGPDRQRGLRDASLGRPPPPAHFGGPASRQAIRNGRIVRDARWMRLRCVSCAPLSVCVCFRFVRCQSVRGALSAVALLLYDVPLLRGRPPPPAPPMMASGARSFDHKGSAVPRCSLLCRGQLSWRRRSQRRPTRC